MNSAYLSVCKLLPLACFAVLFSVSSYSQFTFNKRYEFNGSTGLATSIVETEYGYLFSSISSSSMAMTLLDHQGELLEHKFYPLDTAIAKFNNDHLIFVNDTTLLHAAHAVNPDGEFTQMLVWLNTLGDTLQTSAHTSFFYGDEPINQWDDVSWYVTDRILTDEVGNIYETATIRFASNQLRKFDADGNQVWEYITDETNQHYAVLVDCLLLENNKLIAPTFIVQYNGENDNRAYLTTFSLEGELEEEVLIEDFAERINDVVSTDSGDYILATRPDLGSTFPHLVKVSPQGQVLWEILFDYQPSGYYQQFFTVDYLGNGEYVAGGVIFDSFPVDEEIDGLYDFQGFVAKFSEEGEVIWERRYSGISSIYDWHEFFDLKPTSDGGFVFCGESRDGDSNGDTYEAPGQRAWVVKTDEYGCVVPGCQFVGIDENEDELEYFIAGPNPVSHSLNVFAGISVPHGAEFVITDSRGAIVERFLSTSGSTNYMIEASAWAAGNYIVQLSQGGRILQSEKVVKL